MPAGRRRLAAMAGVLVLTVVASGCGEDPPPPDRTVRPAWQPVALPVPAGGPGPLILRDVVTCAGRWYAVGAVGVAAGATRPAAWTSGDGRSWTALRLRAKTYYGRQNIMYSAGCRDGRLAALGAKIGGAHAYPRTSSWHQLPDGSLDEVIAGYTLFGGAKAVNVARLTAGQRGWLIAGNRYAGAAAWVSPDAAEFQLIEGAPELASDERGETWSFDAAPTDQGWLMVGGVLRPGRTDRDPLAWTSADGVRWQRQEVPGRTEYDELQRVVVAGGAPLALGPRGREFGAWRAENGDWRELGRFGTSASAGVRRTPGLVVAGTAVLAVTADGTAFALWATADRGGSWRPVATPVALPDGPARAVAVAADGNRVLLAVDDGAAGRVWTAVGVDISG